MGLSNNDLSVLVFNSELKYSIAAGCERAYLKTTTIPIRVQVKLITVTLE